VGCVMLCFVGQMDMGWFLCRHCFILIYAALIDIVLLHIYDGCCCLCWYCFGVFSIVLLFVFCIVFGCVWLCLIVLNGLVWYRMVFWLCPDCVGLRSIDPKCLFSVVLVCCGLNMSVAACVCLFWLDMACSWLWLIVAPCSGLCLIGFAGVGLFWFGEGCFWLLLIVYDCLWLLMIVAACVGCLWLFLYVPFGWFAMAIRWPARGLRGPSHWLLGPARGMRGTPRGASRVRGDSEELRGIVFSDCWCWLCCVYGCV